jgi:hypothetical protein
MTVSELTIIEIGKIKIDRIAVIGTFSFLVVITGPAYIDEKQ